MSSSRYPSIASGTSYTAGTGIGISGSVISGAYTAGTGISISGAAISGAYTAGTGIAISGAAISAANTNANEILYGSGGAGPSSSSKFKYDGASTVTLAGVAPNVLKLQASSLIDGAATGKILFFNGGAIGNVTIEGWTNGGGAVNGEVRIRTYDSSYGGVLHEALRLDNLQSLIMADGLTTGGNLATTATGGFFYLRTCSGTPTGTPAAYTGTVPFIYDSTNHKIYVYDGGAWKATAALT